jgi:hypothetical protein
MASFAFTLPVLPGQDGLVRNMGEALLGSAELQEAYEASRRTLGIREEKVWVQETPIGRALVVYWETEDPKRTLRELADSHDEAVVRFRDLVMAAAPALDLSGDRPISSELLFSWPKP